MDQRGQGKVGGAASIPWSAVGVHLFTALGSVCGLMALLAALEGAYERLFLWLGLAFLIDGIDGTFARMVDVKGRLPRFSGDKLDLIVDYVTYVFVPVVALLKAGFLVGAPGQGLAALILLSSLYHFIDEDSKAPDNSFVGFPAVWNIVAFYFFAFEVSAWTAGFIIVALAGLTFVPWRWVHPLRVVALRGPTMALTVLWSAAAAWVALGGFPATLAPGIVLLAGALYVLGLCLYRRGAPD